MTEAAEYFHEWWTYSDDAAEGDAAALYGLYYSYDLKRDCDQICTGCPIRPGS